MTFELLFLFSLGRGGTLLMHDTQMLSKYLYHCPVHHEHVYSPVMDMGLGKWNTHELVVTGGGEWPQVARR